MKTQILQLEPHDDAISVKDKMGWLQTGRILLVWPSGVETLDRKLDLVLLKRHSTGLGAQLGLVCRDTAVRANAEGLGIPVFKSAGEAQSASWRQGRRRQRRLRAREDPPDLEALRLFARPPSPAWLTAPTTRLLLFALGVLAVLAIAAWLLPSAEINLTPEIRTQKITIPVTAGLNIPAVHISGEVPAHLLTVEVEGLASQATSGRMLIPDQPSVGLALFTNLTNQSIAVPEGTVVRTMGEDPVRFALTESGTVPAGSGATVSLPILALSSGRGGNIPSDTLTAIEGPLGLSLTVTNPQSTTGGSDQSSPAASPEDVTTLNQSLLDSLQHTALEEIQNNLNPDDLLLTSTPTLIEVLAETYEPEVTEPADTLSLTLRLEFQVIIISGQDLHILADAILDASLPEGFIPQAETTRIIHLTAPNFDEATSTANWSLTFQRTIQATLSKTQAISLALGLPVEQAEQKLNTTLPLNTPPSITLKPGWWPRMPFLPFRISVVSDQ